MKKVAVFSMVLGMAVLMVAGCATTAKGPSDEEQIRQRIQEGIAGLKAKNYDLFGGMVSENFSSAVVGDKNDLLDYLKNADDMGFLDELEVSLDDAVITVDPHLHRVATLQEAVPVPQAIVLSGAPLLADLIAARRPGALLVGPDGESAQWVAQAAARHGLEHAVCTKERHGDRSVTIHLPPVAVQGRAVVLLDDMASTGHTLAQAARLLLQDGAASVDVAVTHALIDAEALAALHAAGVGEFWSTDCVAHPTNAVAMAVELARGVGQLWGSGADIPG